MGKDYTFDGEIAKYTARIEIRNAVKRGLEKAKHYKKFSKRVVDAVKAELPDYSSNGPKNTIHGKSKRPKKKPTEIH